MQVVESIASTSGLALPKKTLNHHPELTISLKNAA
jgi:pterin-4a-carbinolamine dehydratase